MKTKASSYHHIGRRHLKTFSLSAETLPPNQSLCQMIITITISNKTEPWNQPPPPLWRRLIPRLLLLFLLSLLLSRRRLLCHRYWLSLRVATVTERQHRGCRGGDLAGTFLLWRSMKELRSPVDSDDLCAGLCPLCGLRLFIRVCVSVCVCSVLWGLQCETFRVGTFL